MRGKKERCRKYKVDEKQTKSVVLTLEDIDEMRDNIEGVTEEFKALIEAGGKVTVNMEISEKEYMIPEVIARIKCYWWQWWCR